jgi:acetyltransferase-like isoleucine patch superfamily enzyme
MELTSRLNTLPFGDLDARRGLLGEIFGQPVPDSLNVLPPFYCDYGLGATFGEKVFINQGCFFLDFGGITIGDRVLIGPRVTGAMVAKDVAPFSLVTATSVVVRRQLRLHEGPDELSR